MEKIVEAVAPVVPVEPEHVEEIKEEIEIPPESKAASPTSSKSSKP